MDKVGNTVFLNLNGKEKYLAEELVRKNSAILSQTKSYPQSNLSCGQLDDKCQKTTEL